MGLEDMHLVCHSMGSYIGAKYAHHYPEHVNRMVLLSPLGIEKNDSGFAQPFRRADTDAQICRKWIYGLARYMLKNHHSPIDILRTLGRKISWLLIDDYVTRRLFLTEAEKEYLLPYFYQMALSKKSGELAIGRFIELSLAAYEPTHDEIREAKKKGIKILMAFGETDFTNTKFSGTPVSETLREEGFEVIIIENATHQIFFEKPEECVKVINKIFE